MKTILRLTVCFIAAALIAATPQASDSKAPVVQIGLLLDTSDSMDGLIEQAKSQLWKIVNEFITAKQNGKRPELQVALFEYGNDRLDANAGYIRLIQPLTNDLDRISEELFALRTHGGREYCGWVIKEAVQQLAWSTSPNDYKALFVAGNEPFDQGPVDFRESCKAAIEKGIIVNSIHCGNEATGLATHWRDGALLAEGSFMFIDHNRAVVHFEAPQDKEIARLGTEINRTYIAFGRAGAQGLERQIEQDANSIALSAQGSALNRALFKGSAQYCNDSWDLVDACRNRKVKLTEVKTEDLPPEMQKMTEAERQAYVDAKVKEREMLQSEINRLNAERSKHLAEQAKKAGQTNTLDAVMVAAIREQAAKQNYQFEPSSSATGAASN